MTRALLRHPALHFALLGALLFAGLRDAGPAGATGGDPAAIPPERLEALRAEWLAQAGRPPDAEEWRALRRREVDERLLRREARRRGYHGSDPLVRRRLARNLRFLGAERERSDAELVREALELGMDRSDPVVRRRLVQRMELEAAARARDREPTEAELRAYLAQHAERFREPARVALDHVFFADERRADARAAAERARAALEPEVEAEVAAARGDPFLHGHSLPPLSERALAGLFGTELAEAAPRLPVGAWSGPVRSSYGWHAVRVRAREPARTPELDAVRAAVREGWLEERGRAAVRALVAELRRRHGLPETPDAS